MHRLFAALSVPDTVSQRLLPLAEDLHGAKWRRQAHHHITLCFYGSVSRIMAQELAQMMDRLQHPVLELQVEGVGWFGRREPRALYARLVQNPALDALAADCRKLSRQLGLKTDTAPYVPHITLAYCRHTPLEQVMRWSERYQSLRSQSFIAENFHLFESFTHPGKMSRYVIQEDYVLR